MPPAGTAGDIDVPSKVVAWFAKKLFGRDAAGRAGAEHR